MDKKTTNGAVWFIGGAVATLAALGLGTVAYVYSGGYNIAATEEHSSFVRWAFGTTFRNSVQNGGETVTAPEELTAAMAAAGAEPYKQMCQHCHAGPGADREAWAGGMRPIPPHLTEAAAEWQAEEVFWLVKHGAKMTGMPAFGPSHSDEDIWNIAAFVKQLPAMTPEDYAAAGEGQSSSGDAVNPPPQVQQPQVQQ